MNHPIIRCTVILCTCFLWPTHAQSAIVTSDGPSANTSSALQKIVVSDGPGDSSARPKIITTDGPAVLPYHYPPEIVTTDGPEQLPYSYSSKVLTSDGPGTTREASTHKATHHHAAATDSLPDPATSALAPVSDFEHMNSPVSAQKLTRPMPGLVGAHIVSSREPFYVYSDKQNSGNHFIPSGWMGDYRDIRLDESNRNNPHSGNTCIKVTYTAKGSQGNGWAGIYWQTPANNWGDKPGGYDLTGKHRLTFWARGEKGGEVISEFKIGGIQGENSDSSSASTGSIALKSEWRKYTIGLADLDLTHIIGGFCWTASRDANPDGITFYLDDIRYE